MAAWLVVLLGWFAAALMMLGLWSWQDRGGKVGLVDIGWVLGTGVLGAVFALTRGGYAVREILVAAVVLLWSLRLGAGLVRRLVTTGEDSRYEGLVAGWGERARSRLFWFFQLQASWCVLFAFPALIAASPPTPHLLAGDLVALAIAVIAVVGEGIADHQLARFREDPAHRGKVCDEGLWSWSRHPNYFFEWVYWWSFVAFGWGAPQGWLALVGPALMLLFLTRLTGIPHSERQALARRGEAYRRYQERTSAFFPWPPRRESTGRSSGPGGM